MARVFCGITPENLKIGDRILKFLFDKSTSYVVLQKSICADPPDETPEQKAATGGNRWIILLEKCYDPKEREEYYCTSHTVFYMVIPLSEFVLKNELVSLLSLKK